MKQLAMPLFAHDYADCAETVTGRPLGSSFDASRDGEPCLYELFNDDVMRSIMARDCVATEALHGLIVSTRERLGL